MADGHDPPLLSAARAKALAHPRTALWTSLAACLVVIVGGGKMIGFSLFPKADTPHFLITVETPDGSSLAATDRALQFVEEELRHTPQVLSFFTNLGHGNPQIYYNVTSRDGDISYGDVFVKLRRYDPHDAASARTPARSVQGVSERAHLRAGVQQRPGDQRADRDSRDRTGSRRTASSWLRSWRKPCARRQARVTCRTRCACVARI